MVFVNPSTPDGKYYDLQRLFKIWQEQQCNVIIDESFLDFSDKPSIRKKIRSYKRLYVVQSFTKFYACAGLRVGALFSHRKNIERFILPMWNISSFDAAYVTALLQDEKHPDRAHELHEKQLKKLRKILTRSGIFEKVYKSDVNFILVRSKKAQEIYKGLFERRILVRNCANFDFLDHRYLRFAVKADKELRLLEKALHALA